ncbi:HEAT repeat domain-containing protein [Candidatus Micrarchaeota archaeon]|nr:HEAT repeat domain-containing protein [Candidatus Micrarchaeota archaeon]
MQDQEEEKPSEDGGKPRMEKYKKSFDLNPRDLFWKAMEGEEKGVEQLEHLIANLTITIINERQENYPVKITKTRLMKRVLEVIERMDWEEQFFRLLSESYDPPNKVEPHLLANLPKFLERERIYNWIKENIGDEKYAEGVLAYLSHMKDEEIAEKLKEELMETAKTEIGRIQIFTLETLSVLLEKDEEVKKVFVDLMDDWDPATRKKAIELIAEMKKGDEKAVEKAREIMEYENIPYLKELLNKIIQGE